MKDVLDFIKLLPQNWWGILIAIIGFGYIIILALIKTGNFPTFKKEIKEVEPDHRTITDEQFTTLKNNPIFSRLNGYIQVEIQKDYNAFCIDHQAEFEAKRRDFRVQRVLTLCLTLQTEIILRGLEMQIERLNKVDSVNDNRNIDKQQVQNEIMKQLDNVYKLTINVLHEKNIPSPVINKFMMWYSESNQLFIQTVGEIIRESDSYFDEIRNFLTCSRVYMGDLLSNYRRDMKTFNGDVYHNLTDMALETIDFKYQFLK